MEINLNEKDLEKQIEILTARVNKDANISADDALKFTQAALNAAHTLQILSKTK